MHRPIQITADSSCDIGPILKERYGVVFSHIHVIQDGKEYQDGIDITHEDIYRTFAEKGTLPSTAAMNSAEYSDLFRPYVENGYDVIHISLGSGLSSTGNNARLASLDFDGHVFVIDSKNLSTGSGHIVCEVGERVLRGMAAQDIVDEVLPIIDRVSASFILDDLKYLHASGRCSGLLQFGASLMNIKPCILVKNEECGRMGVGKKYMGSYKRSAIKYVENMLEGRDDIELDRVFITHSGTDESVLLAMRDRAMELQPFEEVFITQASATICSHCGPNTTGILFIQKDKN